MVSSPMGTFSLLCYFFSFWLRKALCNGSECENWTDQSWLSWLSDLSGRHDNRRPCSWGGSESDAISARRMRTEWTDLPEAKMKEVWWLNKKDEGVFWLCKCRGWGDHSEPESGLSQKKRKLREKTKLGEMKEKWQVIFRSAIFLFRAAHAV